MFWLRFLPVLSFLPRLQGRRDNHSPSVAARQLPLRLIAVEKAPFE